MESLLKNRIIKTINLSFLAITSFVLYGGAVVIDLNHCNETIKKGYCNLITPISRPSRFIYSGVLDAYKLVKNGTTSGMVAAKYVEDLNERFKDLRPGFNFIHQKGKNPDAGFLLLSRANPDENGMPIIELWDLNQQSLLKQWNLNVAIKNTIKETGKNSFYFLNPLVMKDGGLLFNTQRAGERLVKIGKNGDIIKINNELEFHHSINQDSEGFIYSTITNNGKQGFAILDENLKILSVHYIDDIFKEHGLLARLYSNNTTDPIHINDVEPLSINGKGRPELVLLSLRSTSSIIFYNLESKRIHSIFDGFTSQQHDVDIISYDPLEISIFDNNVRKKKSYGNEIVFFKNIVLNLDESEMINLYSPNTEQFESSNIEQNNIKFSSLSQNYQPRTISSGLSDYNNASNSLIIEESNFGRIFGFDIESNKISWTYLNTDLDKNNYWRMSWSRFYKVNPLQNYDLINSN